jgi:hypothetical protein
MNKYKEAIMQGLYEDIISGEGEFELLWVSKFEDGYFIEGLFHRKEQDFSSSFRVTTNKDLKIKVKQNEPLVILKLYEQIEAYLQTQRLIIITGAFECI